jgi:hypothetical protein
MGCAMEDRVLRGYLHEHAVTAESEEAVDKQCWVMTKTCRCAVGRRTALIGGADGFLGGGEICLDKLPEQRLTV